VRKIHKCMNCGGYAHGAFCCFEWSARADHGINITDNDAKKVENDGSSKLLPTAMVTHINSNPSKSDICKKCAEIVKGLLSAPVSTPVTTTNSSARAASATSASANAADVLAAAAALPPSTSTAAKKSKGGAANLNSDAPKKKKTKQTTLKPVSAKNDEQQKTKKPRKKPVRFTIQQKIEILEFVKTHGSVKEACRKYGCSKQSISEWQKEDYSTEAARFNSKATRVQKDDPYLRVKIGILAFYDLNKSMPKDLQINITGEVISARAKLIRDRLLERHNEANFLSPKEVKNLQECKFSRSWSNKIAQQNGWRSKRLHGEAGSVDVDKAAPQIEEICTLITEYDIDHVYNMDETGLFFKCLPNRSYLKKGDYKNARGNKLMKAKDRVTIYVCTNADGSDKVPLVMIGKAKKPRCFHNRRTKLKYFGYSLRSMGRCEPKRCKKLLD